MLKITLDCFQEGATLTFQAPKLDARYALSIESMDKILGAIEKLLPNTKPFFGPEIRIKDTGKQKDRKKKHGKR